MPKSLRDEVLVLANAHDARMGPFRELALAAARLAEWRMRERCATIAECRCRCDEVIRALPSELDDCERRGE